MATSISPNVDGPSGRILSAPTFGPSTGRLTLAVRKDALLNRDREGVGACLVPAPPGQDAVRLSLTGSADWSGEETNPTSGIYNGVSAFRSG